MAISALRLHLEVHVMSRSHRRPWLLGVIALGCLALSLPGADPILKPPAKPAGSPQPLYSGGEMGWGERAAFADDVKDILDKLKNELSPEKFKELLDQAEQLKRQGRQFRGKCLLSGRVDGDVAHLRAQFEFKTYQPRESVPLGCQKGWPTSAALDDDQLPLLSSRGEEGFVVQVDKPGPHRLTLDLEVPVTARGTKGSERGFEMGLPGAAITVLDHLDLPANIRDLRVAGRSLTPAEIHSRNDKRKTIALGQAVDRLEVLWRVPAPPPGDPVLASQGTIHVTVDDTHVATDAELTLQVLRGQAKEWKLQVPLVPQTTVDVDAPAGDEKAPVVEKPPDPKNPVWTVKLKEASSDPVTLRIRSYQQRTGKTTGIGPFVVLNAVRQQGTISASAPPHLRLRFKTRGDINQREVSDEQRRGANTVALFTYFNLPLPAKEGQLVQPPLELEVESIKGGVETVTSHSLQLAADGWAVTTEIDVRAENTQVERLEIELPPSYEPKAAPPSLVESDLEIKDAGPGRRIGTVKLTSPRKQFKLLLHGTWPLPEEPAKGVAIMPLPRPYQTIDRGGGTVKIAVPDDRELLLARESGLQILPPGRRSHTFTTERAPARVEAAWRDYRPELPVEMLVDLTLTDRQAQVRQRLRLQFPLDAQRQLVLRYSDPLDGRAPTGERLNLTPQGPNAWAVALKDVDPKDRSLTLEYSFVPEADRKTGRFTVPLLWPDGITHCQTRVRIWSEPGAQPAQDGDLWDELPLEVVPEKASLPALVLRRSGINLPLRLKEQAVAALPTVAVDRVLVQAAVSDGGHQSYRVRFLINKLTARSLDVELPASPGAINLDVLLDSKRVTALQVIDQEGNPVDTEKIIRLRFDPEQYRRPVVLDLRYQVPPGKTEGAGRLQTSLVPPRLRGNVFAGRVRWQVGLPADWVPVTTGGPTTIEQRWGFRAWLPAPRSALSAAELERWFAGAADQSGLPDLGPGLGSRSSELVCWQAALAPLRVYHVAEPTWLLVCSLGLLVIALGLYLASLMIPRAAVALSLALGALVVLAFAFWPGLLPVVLYGCEPGLVVLLLVVGFLWFRQQRYRRQVVFMPGFSRVSTGSSVISAGSSQRRREPSTIDGPLPGAGSELSASRQELAPKNP
jgi:hypothetical protein